MFFSFFHRFFFWEKSKLSGKPWTFSSSRMTLTRSVFSTQLVVVSLFCPAYLIYHLCTFSSSFFLPRRNSDLPLLSRGSSAPSSILSRAQGVSTFFPHRRASNFSYPRHELLPAVVVGCLWKIYLHRDLNGCLQAYLVVAFEVLNCRATLLPSQT